MRTKHLLTAIVLPALFAACTNDELAGISQNTESVNGRKLAGDVTLSFDLGENANTRLAYAGGKYTWEADDQIGACLMDEMNLTTPGNNYNTPGAKWSEKFNLTTYIQTNYKFTRNEAGKWNTEAKLCEGNYFFCYPYNANMGLREAYTLSVGSQAMENTNDAALLKAYAKNNAFVGYGKVVASDEQKESLGIDMMPVFGGNGFELINTGTKTYTIEKIVLHGKKVVDSAIINPTTCTELIQKGTNLGSGADVDFNVAQYVGDVADNEYVNNFNAYDAEKALVDVLDYQGDATNGKSIEVTLAAGNVIGTGKSIRIVAMTGAETLAAYNGADAGTKDLAVLDIYTDKGMIRGIELNNRYQANDASNPTATNVLTDVALTKLGAGQRVRIEFDDTSVDVPNKLDVCSNEDLASLIHWNAKTATDIVATLKTDVTITKAMYNELAASRITKATLTGAKKVTFAADVPAAALDRFVYAGSATVEVKGTQTLAESHTGTAITVAAGATLNVTGDVYTTITTGAITNNGTLNVNGILSATTTNKGIMSIAAGKSVSALTNNGTVTNAGTITALTDNVKSKNTDAATITNTGNIVSGKNSNVINNNAGEVTLSENAVGAVVYANNKSATTVSTTNSGSIVITKLEDDGNFKVPPTAGSVVQEIASASTTAVDDRANTVWLTGTLTVDPNKDKDGAIQDVDLSGVLVYAKSANARIEGNGKTQTLRLDNIQIAESSALVISAVNIDFKNASTAIVMEGKANKAATLTINSNASYNETNVILPTPDANNIVKNFTNK